MPHVNMTISIDEDIKRRLDQLCDEIGMSSSVAINIFARKMVRDRKFPFEVGAIPASDGVEILHQADALRLSKSIIDKNRPDFEELAK